MRHGLAGGEGTRAVRVADHRDHLYLGQFLSKNARSRAGCVVQHPPCPKARSRQRPNEPLRTQREPITCHPKRSRAGIDHVPCSAGSAVSPCTICGALYDNYLDIEHKLCCAHAQRELAGVAEAAAGGAQWCWATQDADTLDPKALAIQIHHDRCAAQIGISQIAGLDAVIKNTTHWPVD